MAVNDFSDLLKLKEEIDNDFQSNKISLNRYPVRFIFLNSHEELRELVNFLTDTSKKIELSSFLLDEAFEKEDLNLNDGDNLYIFFGCTERNYTKLKKKRFYLSYYAYFLNSNNQIKDKLIIDKYFNLEEEIPLSSKNEALLIYEYKKISNSINNGTKTQNFSSLTPYENSKFILSKEASLLPGFAIIIEDTKELRILEVIPDFTFLKFFIMILGSISFIINIFVVIYCLNKNRIRIHSSQIEASIRDNLPNNEFNNNNNGIIAD